MIKSHANFNPDTMMFEVGMETTKHLYIMLITANIEEAKRMLSIIESVIDN